MKKILILGSDYGTVDLVKEAKKQGLCVICADLMKSSPTKQAADEAWLMSTTDYEALERKIREENICAILAGASEFNIEKQRYLCKKLNLPLYCMSDNAWGVARNKRRFKDYCRQCGVEVAEDYFLSDALTDEELDKVRYPVVVKPVDCSGNLGMSYCENKEQLISGRQLAESVSDNADIIIERRLHGPSYTSYYVLAEGEAVLTHITNSFHQPGYSANLYSFELITQHRKKQFMAEVNQPVIELLKTIGCREGVAWVEYIYDEDGHFYALEMAHRFAGPVSYAAHERLTGFNTYRWFLDCALGIEHKKEQLPRFSESFDGCGASYNLFTCMAGKIESIEGLEEIEKLPNVMLDVPKRAGDSVRAWANMGVLRIAGRDADELIDTVKFINSTLRVKNAEGENMFIVFDDYDSIAREYEEGLKEAEN